MRKYQNQMQIEKEFRPQALSHKEESKFFSKCLLYGNETLTQIFSETQTSEPDQNHVSDPILRALEIGGSW